MADPEDFAPPDRPLRRGWTTGACATAATRAALTALLSGQFEDPVTITLPAGAQARALRLSVTGNTGWEAAQLSEFEIYG